MELFFSHENSLFWYKITKTLVCIFGRTKNMVGLPTFTSGLHTRVHMFEEFFGKKWSKKFSEDFLCFYSFLNNDTAD